MNTSPISEDDLQAYVDSALPSARQAVVETHLAQHPEDAERVRVYRAQKQALRSLFDPVLDEPLPDKLRELAVPPRPASAASRWSLQRVAASIAIALIGAGGGWLARGPGVDRSVASVAALPRQAAVAHAVFTPDVRRPVEVGAEHEDQLVAWLSKRLGTPVRPPHLQAVGFDLVGGRLLPGNSGPVAQFMYQDSNGRRLTLYVSTENVANQETAFRFAQEGPVNVFYWIDGKFGYALSASIAKDELARVSKAVYDQIEAE
jgi:anti-sigma factor RsiW